MARRISGVGRVTVSLRKSTRLRVRRASSDSANVAVAGVGFIAFLLSAVNRAG
jgi:hypothetical protein